MDDIIVLFLIIIAFIFIIRYLLNEETDISDLVRNIDEGTVFHFITKPEIVCIIEEIKREDYINPRMTLIVKYPSGKQVRLQTTVSEFKKLWRELDY